MGADCRTFLPGNVSVGIVSRAVGIAAGLPFEKKPLGEKDYWYVDVPAVVVMASVSVPEMCTIQWRSRTPDRRDGHTAYYHFEPAGVHSGMRLVSVKSTAFWIAVSRKLVDFFGGESDYNDCDDRAVNYKKKYGHWTRNSPQDGEEWQDLQERLSKITPVTVEDLKRWNKEAGYDTSGEWLL